MSYNVQKAVAERVVGKVGEVSALLRKAILMNLAVRANDDGSGIYASKLKIAVWLETTERSVRRAVDTLLADGLLIEVGEKTMGNGAVLKDYTINLDALAQLPYTQDTFEEERAKERKRKKRGADKASDTPLKDRASGKGGQGVRPQADKASGFSDKASADNIHTSSKPSDTGSSSATEPKKKTPFDRRWTHLSEANRAYATEKGLLNGSADEAFEGFRDYHLQNGSKFVDWGAAWRTWVRNQVKFAKERELKNESTVRRNDPNANRRKRHRIVAEVLEARKLERELADGAQRRIAAG